MISAYVGQTPPECMRKINEIRVTGSLAAGA